MRAFALAVGLLLALADTLPASAQAPSASAAAAPACVPNREHAKQAEEILGHYIEYVATAELERLDQADDIAGLRETHRRGVNWISSLLCDSKALDGSDRSAAISFAQSALDAAQRVEAALKVETECESTDKCMGGRVCEAVAHRDELRRQIAQERANPGGVVNLKLLHDLGEGVQGDEQLIAARKKRFLAARKKAFAQVCR
jgi:hypothetical protein